MAGQTAAVNLTECTADELRGLYARREASPVEATAAVLEAIDELNPVLNAFCLVAADEAMVSATGSEARWHRGEPIGPLDGVPTSIKDLVLTRGLADAAWQPDHRPRATVGRRCAGDRPPA